MSKGAENVRRPPPVIIRRFDLPDVPPPEMPYFAGNALSEKCVERNSGYASAGALDRRSLVESRGPLFGPVL